MNANTNAWLNAISIQVDLNRLIIPKEQKSIKLLNLRINKKYYALFLTLPKGCNAARCDEELGHCVIGLYDETMGCSSDIKTIYEIKEKGTPSM